MFVPKPNTIDNTKSEKWSKELGSIDVNQNEAQIASEHHLHQLPAILLFISKT